MKKKYYLMTWTNMPLTLFGIKIAKTNMLQTKWKIENIELV